MWTIGAQDQRGDRPGGLAGVICRRRDSSRRTAGRKHYYRTVAERW